MSRVAWLAMALALGPFIIKRIILLGAFDYSSWLAIDYGARCINLTLGVADAINAFVLGVLLGIAFWRTRRTSICVVVSTLST